MLLDALLFLKSLYLMGLLFFRIMFKAFVKLSLNKYLTITLTSTNTSAIHPVINKLNVESE